MINFDELPQEEYQPQVGDRVIFLPLFGPELPTLGIVSTVETKYRILVYNGKEEVVAVAGETRPATVELLNAFFDLMQPKQEDVEVVVKTVEVMTLKGKNGHA